MVIIVYTLAEVKPVINMSETGFYSLKLLHRLMGRIRLMRNYKPSNQNLNGSYVHFPCD